MSVVGCPAGGSTEPPAPWLARGGGSGARISGQAGARAGGQAASQQPAPAASPHTSLASTHQVAVPGSAQGHAALALLSRVRPALVAALPAAPLLAQPVGGVGGRLEARHHHDRHVWAGSPAAQAVAQARHQGLLAQLLQAVAAQRGPVGEPRRHAAAAQQGVGQRRRRLAGEGGVGGARHAALAAALQLRQDGGGAPQVARHRGRGRLAAGGGGALHRAVQDALGARVLCPGVVHGDRDPKTSAPGRPGVAIEGAGRARPTTRPCMPAAQFGAFSGAGGGLEGGLEAAGAGPQGWWGCAQAGGGRRGGRRPAAGGIPVSLEDVLLVG